MRCGRRSGCAEDVRPLDRRRTNGNASDWRKEKSGGDAAALCGVARRR